MDGIYFDMKVREEIGYLKECFVVVDGVLYWRKDRPESHFKDNLAYKSRYYKSIAGQAAGCVKEDRKGLFYIYLKLNTRQYYAHQIIWAMEYGYYAETINHKDGNGLNNLITNLEISDARHDGKTRRLNKNSTSGIKGVTFSKNSCKWQASIWVNGKSIYLGQFESLAEAENIAKEARLEAGYIDL